MSSYLEIWGAGAPALVMLEADRLTLGRATTNDLVLDADSAISRLHAVFERYSSAWSVRDLGSSNGTYVNGERIVTERRLEPGDEIRVGGTRLVFRADEPDLSSTAAAEAPPNLTPRERDVVLALCRPMARGIPFAQPATVEQMAAELVVSESAIKAHLVKLYDKFGLYGPGESRRVQLANEAVRRRAISLADLLDAPTARHPR
ncbi:MAG: FHA domain-containing protein [Gaiellales bacterium]